MSVSLPDPSEAWVFDLCQSELDPAVPEGVRRLFETARSTLAYSLMFYPLLTLGAEQLFRVLEAAVSIKCKAMNAPASIRVFAKKIEWLGENGLISSGEQRRWDAIRHLRNLASHPEDQAILSQSDALHILDSTVELTNSLFTAAPLEV
jgi:hypothetical protein